MLCCSSLFLGRSSQHCEHLRIVRSLRRRCILCSCPSCLELTRHLICFIVQQLHSSLQILQLLLCFLFLCFDCISCIECQIDILCSSCCIVMILQQFQFRIGDVVQKRCLHSL